MAECMICQLFSVNSSKLFSQEAGKMSIDKIFPNLIGYSDYAFSNMRFVTALVSQFIFLTFLIHQSEHPKRDAGAYTDFGISHRKKTVFNICYLGIIFAPTTHFKQIGVLKQEVSLGSHSKMGNTQLLGNAQNRSGMATEKKMTKFASPLG